MRSRCAVVIPVHGHSGLTRRCLDALLAEPAADQLEIVVVDDASPDATGALLESYGPAIRVHTRESSAGFATACREGAALTDAPLLLFLNNDTLGYEGWVEAIFAEADAHPTAAVVGAKLLFPDGTVQHAGVAIGQDRLPRHIYAGFPADHPAVCRSREFQAVTGACMLVRRDAWDRVGGFDPAYRNGLEDTDLCLRLGREGAVIRCCHDSVLMHLESPTRGHRGPDLDAGVARFRERWDEVLSPDDLSHYVADGLLSVAYAHTHPVRFEIDPLLGVVDGRDEPLDRLLLRRAAQVNELLRETVRLSAEMADLDRLEPIGDRGPREGSGVDHEGLMLRAQAIEAEIGSLQEEIVEAFPDSRLAEAGVGAVFAYRRLVNQIRSFVSESVPPGATVLVVSRGDDELVELEANEAWHFPQADSGRYLGHHPAGSDEAIEHLEELRARGGEYLLLPRTAYWWLDHYREFAMHLDKRYTPIGQEEESCRLYALAGGDDGADR